MQGINSVVATLSIFVKRILFLKGETPKTVKHNRSYEEILVICILCNKVNKLTCMIYIWFVQAPIYVSKEIVFTDAIRLGYGMGRVHNKKAIYDVLLDRYCIVIVSYVAPFPHRFCVPSLLQPPLVVSFVSLNFICLLQSYRWSRYGSWRTKYDA